MDGRKTAIIVAIVALGLCLLVGVALVLLGGFAFLVGRDVSISPSPVVVVATPAIPARSADVHGYALSGAVSDTTLSVFDTEDLLCHWRRLDPVSGRKEDVAGIEGPCSGVRAAWSPDGTKGIVWLDPLEEGWRGTAAINGDAGQGGDRMWTVTFDEGKFAALARPPAGELMELGFDGQGRAIAITSEEISDGDARRGFVEYDGKRLEIPEGEGLPILAHAFRLEDGRWTPMETKASNDGADLSEGIRALDVWKQLGPRSDQMLNGQPDAKEVEDKGTLAKLAELTKATLSSGGDDETMPGTAGDDASGEDGQWGELATGGGSVYVWEESAEGLFATGLIAFRDGDRVVRPEKLELGAADAASPMVRGSWLLITGQDGETPHLYDVRTRKLAWSDEKASGTTFWPK
ncbi:MAG TPA: hypothetical protein VMV18_12255 [bacterium]|nr:hypothetical protein [bacterium]